MFGSAFKKTWLARPSADRLQRAVRELDLDDLAKRGIQCGFHEFLAGRSRTRPNGRGIRQRAEAKLARNRRAVHALCDDQFIGSGELAALDQFTLPQQWAMADHVSGRQRQPGLPLAAIESE